MNVAQNITNNYLVPADGQTHSVQIAGVFSAQPFVQDWQQYTVDNFPFIPQGVFIDNTQGVGPLTITIAPIGYTIVCPTGVSAQYQFPATKSQQWSITGDGQANIFAVDFPVLPGGAASNIGNNVSVTVTGATNQASPVYTEPSNAPGGLPYQVQKTVLPLTAEYLSTTGAAATVAPGALNLRKLLVTVSGDAAMATAGRNLITISLNGIAILKVSPRIPAAAGTDAVLSQYEIAFDDAALNAGAGTLSVSAANVLTSGIIEVNAYFD